MARRPRWSEHHRQEFRRPGGERVHEAPVVGSITAEPRRCVLDRSLDDDHRAVVEGMRDWRRWSDELEPQRREERQQWRKGHDRRADVVAKARLEKLLRPQASAGEARRLQAEDRLARFPSVMAAARPLGPEPTTTASNCSAMPLG